MTLHAEHKIGVLLMQPTGGSVVSKIFFMVPDGPLLPSADTKRQTQVLFPPMHYTLKIFRDKYVSDYAAQITMG